jgi:amino acid permease
MTTDYQADQGKKLFGIGVLFFGHGLFVVYHSSLPGGIFTLQPLNIWDAFLRASIVIGAILAAYGILVWRSASRKLSLANYMIVFSCASVVVLSASKMAEWVHFSTQQRGSSFLVDLEACAIQLTMVICIVAFGGWWADSAYMQARFHRYIRSNRFIR